MKATLLIAILLMLSYSATDAKSLQDAKLWEDMHSILKDYHFQLPSSSGWEADDHALLEQGKVFTGSAYFVVDDPNPSVQQNAQMAGTIRDAFRKLYDLESESRNGSSAVPLATAYFVWTNEDRDHPRGDESITFRVQVMTLPGAKIGILLSFVHVTPRATPKA